MTQTTAPEKSDAAYHRDLGDNLVLRWSTADDFDRIADLYAHVFRDGLDKPLNEGLRRWTSEMMSGRHPLIGPGDFAVVENTETGKIAASTCLIAQEWEYEGVRFPIGRPEVVASDPAYRRRGLVRAVFELIHARAAARGALVTAITGIAYYYRVFGYEYALELEGGWAVALSAIPALKDGAAEPFTLREATGEDIPLLASLYDRQRARAEVSTVVDESYWRWMIDGIRKDASEYWRVCLIIAMEDQKIVGYVRLPRDRWGAGVGVFALWLDDGLSYTSVLPSLLRAAKKIGEENPAPRTTEPLAEVVFSLGRSHPVYEALGPRLRAFRQRDYAWYVRVPDLVAFIQRIAPALERRLAEQDSPVAAYSGAVNLDFYRDGLRLVFEKGRLVTAEEWRIPVWGKADAGFPPLVFLQLLFGWRSLGDLRHAFPDVWTTNDEVHTLLETLFPAKPSWVVPLD